MLVDKKDLSEQEIRTRYITPAIRNAGWPADGVREELYLTAGQIQPRGRHAPRGTRKFADYVLYHRNRPLAVVEAKDNNHSLGGGMQQALEYADMLDAPFAYSSNGDGFLEHDLLATGQPGQSFTIEMALPLDQFPSPGGPVCPQHAVREHPRVHRDRLPTRPPRDAQWVLRGSHKGRRDEKAVTR